MFFNRKENASQKPKTTDISLSEFIGYGIHPQNQNLTALYQSQGIKNRVRVYRYSYGCSAIFLSILMIKKLTDTFYDEGHCGRSILKKKKGWKSLTRCFFVRSLGNL